MKKQDTLFPNLFFIKLKQSALLFILLPFLCSCSESPQVPTISNPNETRVSGTLASDTVWSRDNSPYIVTGDVIVPREVTLTVEPGTEVRFNGFYILTVQGRLNAVGSPNEPILFTSHQSHPEIGKWRGIIFDNTDDENILQYIRVEYADVGIRCSLSSPQIMDCWIMRNRTGILLEISSANIAHSLIKDNFTGIHAKRSFNVLIGNINHNVITRNENGIIAEDGGLQVTENNIFDNLEHSILVNARCNIDIRNQRRTCDEIKANGNWWGSVDAKSITDQIFDNKDFGDLGHVIYTPYATSEISDAGPRL